MTSVEFEEQMNRLVAFRTLSSDLEINRLAVEYIKGLLPLGVNTDVVENNGALIFLAGSGEDLYHPEFGYLVHVDVVSGRDDQFEMNIEGDNIYGRGVSDMKFSIPVGIALLEAMVKARKDLTFVVTTDEEIGGGNGGNYLANSMNFFPKVLIVPDGGDNFEFVNKSKGVAHIWVESIGVPTHASTIWAGKNALHPLVELANELLRVFQINEHAENWGTTLNIGVVNGGLSTNQVCPSAVMKLDFRFPESESVDGIVKLVEEKASSIDSDLRVSLAASGDPTYSSTANPYIARVLRVGQEVLGREMKVRGAYGASDARYFAKFNIPIVMFKPEGGGIHGDKEWINVPSVLKFYEILEKFMMGV